MFEELRTNKLNNLMLPGQIIAGWLLQEGDLEWLKKEYAKMSSIFEDSPVIEWIKEDALEKALKKAREEVNRQLLEERQRAVEADKRALEEHQRALEERQRALEGFRQAVVAIVSGYFPKLARLAQKQVRLVEDQERLQQLLRHISTLRNAKEVEKLLLDLDEDEE